MILKKGNGNANPPYVGGGPQRKSIEPDDHWTFLEEIEAPMWVDLTLEAQVMANDIEDTWFQSTHPFHQYSSHDLMSMFSLSSEGKLKSPDLQHPHPKLPSSVSRSRGKHYRSRKWKGVDHDAISVNKHPIRILGGKKSAGLISGSGALHSNSTTSTLTSMSPKKVTTNSGDQTGSRDSKECHNAGCNSGSTVTSGSIIRTNASFGDSKTTSNCQVDLVTENAQHPSTSEVYHHMFGQTNGFLSAVRISLTKSCVTRHASRVEVKDRACSKDRKSSLSKSSIGSSYNHGSDLKNINIHENKRVSKIRKDTTTVRPGNCKRNSSNVAKTTFGGQLRDRSSDLVTQHGGKLTASEYNCQGSRAKILQSTVPRKPLFLHNQTVPLKERVTSKSKKEVSSGKVRGEACGGKENKETGLNQNQKASTCAARIKDRHGLADLKGKPKGKAQGANPSKVGNRIHFR